MASVNKVILVGRLGADPETKMTPSGKQLCNLRVATTSKYKDKETTEWHRIVCWDKTAEMCGKFLSKGREVFVEGRLQTRSYEKDGQKHYATDIVADHVVFLGGKGEQNESHPAEEKARKAFPGAKSVTPEDDSSVPF